MNSFGKAIRVNIFGESHGQLIGITIDGLPAGVELDVDYIKSELDKRGSKTSLTTLRRESDDFEIVSGYFNGFTSGSPLTFLIKNNDVRSSDYDKFVLRPSHADFTAFTKYDGFQDYRGGGHFSGRLTVCITIIGAIALSILKSKGIEVKSQIKEIGDFVSSSFLEMDVNEINNKEEVHEKVYEIVDKVKNEHDSIGGIVETAILGLKAGIGEPFFDSVESILSHLVFSIPGIKGIEFGRGFDFAHLTGSEANDEFKYEERIITETNNSGGINGGISNGMPIIVRSVFRPTPTIGKPQRSVNYKTKETLNVIGKGRHDPAIILRGFHVVNNIIAFGILDLIVRTEGIKWIR
ncbi:chorismate synthase [Mycoplasmatota bacterium zrk1]